MPFFDAEGDFEGYAGASLDVTEAEELRRELDTVRELFATVTEAGPFVVLRTDVEGKILYAHGSWPDILSEVELVGLNWPDLLAAEQVDEIVTRGLASITTREPYTVRVRGDHPDADIEDLVVAGSGEVWGELRVAPVFTDDGDHDGFVATLADVSAEVAAGRRADLLARVLDAGSDFLMVAERNGAISYVNDAAQQTLGVRGSSADGSPSFLMDVLQPESYEIFREVVEPTLAREQIWRGELNFHSWSGAVIPVSALFLAHESQLGVIESISAVARDITDLKDAERRLRELATHDYLTGLPNRVLLYDRLEQALARFQRHGQAVALLYLDLDRFKPVNDEFGHQVGDAVLIEIADRIHTVIRDTDTAARIGGDEFAVLIEGVEDPGLLRLVADRLIEAMSRPVIGRRLHGSGRRVHRVGAGRRRPLGQRRAHGRGRRGDVPRQGGRPRPLRVRRTRRPHPRLIRRDERRPGRFAVRGATLSEVAGRTGSAVGAGFRGRRRPACRRTEPLVGGDRPRGSCRPARRPGLRPGRHLRLGHGRAGDPGLHRFGGRCSGDRSAPPPGASPVEGGRRPPRTWRA